MPGTSPGMTSLRNSDYFTVPAPVLQATASWSPVALLQPRRQWPISPAGPKRSPGCEDSPYNSQSEPVNLKR